MNDDWLELLRSAHNEPIHPAHYAAVRARVLSSVGLRPAQASVARRLAWLFGIIVALLSPQALRRPDLPPPPRVAIAVPPAPLGGAGPRPAERPKVAAHRQPLTIKLQTSDPNIVIYWIAD